MNNREEYKKALDEITASDELKRKTIYMTKEKKQTKFVYKIANAMAVVLVLFGMIFILESSKIENVDLPAELKITKKEINLPKVENVDNLIGLLQKNNYLDDSRKQYSSFVSANTVSESAMDEVKYSNTNVQVEGVDEADIVKTDGEYIYYISNNKLVIAKAGEDMQIVNETKYVNNDDMRVVPIEMYIDGNKLIMVARTYEKTEDVYFRSSLIRANYKTIVVTYDITNKANPTTYKQFEIEGDYVSSRMVNGTIYMITNKYIYINDETDVKEDDVVQKYTDSIRPSENDSISLQDVYYIPDSEENCYMNIIAFDTQTKREAEIITILGAGSNVYATDNSIYVMNTKYEFNEEEDGLRDYYTKTMIYRFDVERRNITYNTKGEVPGGILNQFSVDEYNGNFRIATTENKDGKNVSALYVLDNNLNIISKLENLAENERIYAVRFMKDKGYIVTFRQTDPLFVVDLSNPIEPKILGELKIPGYSSYLHPYDDNHIIGFGQDIEIKKDAYGREYTQQNGLKISMFDVSDLSNPVEMFNIILGAGGTYSTAEYDHKSLLFIKDKNILAFPILMNKNLGDGSRVQPDFQGVMVLNVDLENGFSEKGRIAHMQITNGYDDYKYEQVVERVIYINDDFYTLSPATIKRVDMNTMEELEKVEIEVEEEKMIWGIID